MDKIPEDELKNAVLQDDEKIFRVQGTRQNYKENQKLDKRKEKEDKASKKREKKKYKAEEAQKKRNKLKQKDIKVWPETNKTSQSLNFKPKKPSILSRFSIGNVIKGGKGFKHPRYAVLEIPEEMKEKDFMKSSNKTVNRQMAFDIHLVETEENRSTPFSTSSEENEEWVGFEHYSDERDDEWLGVQREMTLPVNRNTLKEKRKLFLGSAQLDIGCEEFMASMKYFWWVLYLGGRMPFQTYIEDYIVKFKLNKSSIPFIYFSLTSTFLIFCTTTMAYSVIRIAALIDQGSLSFHERVERLDVDKYWIYTLVTFVSLAVSSSCSLATIFDDGFLVADFLSRWNVAISVLKYRPVSRIRLYFWLNASVFLLYAGTLILLFYTEIVPAVRGTSGLIGLLIVRPFTFEIRFSRSFPNVEKFGLFVHLYTIYSSRVILIMVTLYCRLLVNAARKWNLRLAYVMGMLGDTVGTEGVVAVISFPKLFLEHAIIVGFLRHTGRIFAVGLGIFYILKTFELLILVYRTATLFIHPLPTFNETHVQGTPEFLPPIAYTDPSLTLYLTVTVLLLHSCAEWLITTEQITTCGDAIMDGYSFIRRWGLILSKTSQRRRFVQSLNHAFSGSSDYYVRAGFTINREFTFNIFFWLCVFSALFLAFSPFQLQRELITVCSQNGRCVTVSKSRTSWKTGTKSKAEIISDIEKQNIEELPTIITRTRTTRTTTRPTRTTEKPLIPGRNCLGDWSGNPEVAQLPQACLSNGSIYKPYLEDEDCPMFTDPLPNPYIDFVPGGSLELFDCNSPGIKLTHKRDSCGNIGFYNVRTRRTTVIRATVVADGLPGSGVPYIMCCYDYGFGQKQLDHCNLPFSRATAKTCGIQMMDTIVPPYRFNLLDPALIRCFDPNPDNRPPTCNVDHCFCDPLAPLGFHMKLVALGQPQLFYGCS